MYNVAAPSHVLTYWEPRSQVSVAIVVLLTLQFLILVPNSGWCGLTSTHFRDQIWRVTRDKWMNTHLKKCSVQGTPEGLPYSRLVTWFRSKTKEICNKVCRWLFPSSTSFRATTEKVSNSLNIYIQGSLTLKNKVIKRVGFEVLTAVSMMIAVFWVVAPPWWWRQQGPLKRW
jgi:hypothetical protein